MSIQVLCPLFLHGLFFFVLLLSYISSVHIVDINPHQIHDLQIFFPFHRLSLNFIGYLSCCAVLLFFSVVPLIDFYVMCCASDVTSKMWPSLYLSDLFMCGSEPTVLKKRKV